MDPNCPKSLEDIEDIEKVDSDAEHGHPNPDPSNADQETIQEDAADPIETTTVEMEKLEDLEPNDISLEENNQASFSTLSTGTLGLDVSENPNDNLEIIEVKDPKTFLTKVCYGFLALTLAFTIGVVFWGIQSQNSNPDFVIPETKVDTLNNTCPVWSLVGDNYCDDQAIKPECGYDFNDCCQMENDRSLCQHCFCYLSDDAKESLLEQHVNECEFWPYSGNGICDLKNNDVDHFFDVGDCCQENPICRIVTGLLESTIVPCPENICIQSNNFCIPEELGDGLCQDHNNGPFCDYDLGDCCLHFSTQNNLSLTDCCFCSCKKIPPIPQNWVPPIVG